MSVPSSALGPPSPGCECVSPLVPVPKEGGATLSCGWGGGGNPIRATWNKAWHSVYSQLPQKWLSYQCCGSEMFFPIPDPTFFHPGSEFSPSRIRIKEFKYFNPKNGFWALGIQGSKGTGSRIRNTVSYIYQFVLDSTNRIETSEGEKMYYSLFRWGLDARLPELVCVGGGGGGGHSARLGGGGRRCCRQQWLVVNCAGRHWKKRTIFLTIFQYVHRNLWREF